MPTTKTIGINKTRSLMRETVLAMKQPIFRWEVKEPRIIEIKLCKCGLNKCTHNLHIITLSKFDGAELKTKLQQLRKIL